MTAVEIAIAIGLYGWLIWRVVRSVREWRATTREIWQTEHDVEAWAERIREHTRRVDVLACGCEFCKDVSLRVMEVDDAWDDAFEAELEGQS